MGVWDIFDGGDPGQGCDGSWPGTVAGRGDGGAPGLRRRRARRGPWGPEQWGVGGWTRSGRPDEIGRAGREVDREREEGAGTVG